MDDLHALLDLVQAFFGLLLLGEQFGVLGGCLVIALSSDLDPLIKLVDLGFDLARLLLLAGNSARRNGGEEEGGGE